MKLPNKTHPDSPIGDQHRNLIIKEQGKVEKINNPKSHLEIGQEFDLFNFFNGNVKAWGIVQDRSGNVVSKFNVNIDGSIENNALIILLVFSFQS